MNNNSGFGDINNCSSLDSSVVSSPTVNNIRRNSFYKLTNVLLLLFLVFGSCVVSFGMENVNENLKKNEIKDLKKNENKDLKKIENKDNDEINLIGVTLKNRANTLKDLKNSYIAQLSPGIALLLSFAPGLITGIGGYNNTWKPLKENWGLYWYRSNPWLAYGLNKRIYDSNYIDVDLHILGINFLAFLESIIILSIHITINKEMLSSETFLNQAQKTWQEKIVIIITNFCTLLGIGMYQFLDVEIKVFKYWSISLNLCVPYSLFTGRLKLYQLNI